VEPDLDLLLGAFKKRRLVDRLGAGHRGR
jgi:hypothetical protein